MSDFIAEVGEMSAEDLAARLYSRLPAVRASRDGVDYLDAQRLLYLLHVARIQPMWECVVPAVHDPAAATAFQRLDAAWNQVQVDAALATVELPDVAGFEAWMLERCRTHPSGPQHPLFALLEKEADVKTLREFVFQETPFDIHFGDLIAMLIPGIYGGAKIELAENFWDEMGNGDVLRTHRRLRLNMMSAVGIGEDSHLAGLESFWVQELELANLYFSACASRRLMDQALGMLLATEHVVPGRIDLQLNGWRRLGYQEDQLEYLSEHIVVDVEHAAGWLNEVVKPALATHPETLTGVVAGIECRLAMSLRVCDRALEEFQGPRH